ncbi:kelch repeat and BTB domain-containing protein 3-like isoform X2 [Dinothrombium tinctorium]|uniref:Kelch repeat and BTB domain-containing protein 3-like isoform X2 n=1 Tax=Dinothrombium tinctorium TaxID=1965070 RepID=A0A3S3Q9K2_9ACAR|nr:kelch repeat and BTB domain-containing protein 3-like isoform X2 [Dinothrombium tinctorium]RWS05848.1 kelch repeat and BTB domain-containing protein 3-like isoform X2 [Dinothrombium tinctorium]
MSAYSPFASGFGRRPTHAIGSCVNPYKRQKTIYTLNGDDFLRQQITAVSRDLKDGIYADFRIVVENREIPVHRIILKSASDKFETMFEIDMKEKREGKVYITERSFDAVKAMVDYIYGNEVSNAKEVCSELLEMAEEYNIPKLKNDCENYIKGRINHCNVYEVLSHAYKYNANELMDAALKYICDYRKELITKEKCSQLDSDLKDQLLEYIANHL